MLYKHSNEVSECICGKTVKDLSAPRCRLYSVSTAAGVKPNDASVLSEPGDGQLTCVSRHPTLYLSILSFHADVHREFESRIDLLRCRSREDVYTVEQQSGEQQDTVLGIAENVEGLLCYILGWLSGLVFLLLEKENEFVRFHAMQSVVVFGALFILSLILGAIPILGWIISILLWPAQVILVIFLMYKAYSGERFKLPVAGDFAEEQLG